MAQHGEMGARGLEDGSYIASDTPKGIWAITDAGRRYLESLKRGEHGAP